MDNRGLAPVVGKALEASVVVLYVGLLATALYGGVVPEYRTVAGSEVADRVLAESAHRVQQAIPTDARAVRVRIRVSLPDTIRGRTYAVRTDGRALVLDHPAEGIGGRVRLAVPGSVSSVEGSWSSGESTVVEVRSREDGLAIRLDSGGDR